MSGGVDSSVAAALLVEAGHDVGGATMKLWGGPSDAGRCSVDDVDDARPKDQSYVLSVLGQDQLARTLLPVGHLTKTDVRARASELGLRTAAKPDSQEVCFISSGGGRAAFLAERLPLHAGRVVDAAS